MSRTQASHSPKVPGSRRGAFCSKMRAPARTRDLPQPAEPQTPTNSTQTRLDFQSKEGSTAPVGCNPRKSHFRWIAPGRRNPYPSSALPVNQNKTCSIALTLLPLSFFLIPLSSFAACTQPTAPTGAMVFNTTHKVMQYCNGSQWVNTGPSIPTATQNGCTNPTGPAGGVIYNGALGVIQFCNGENWVDTACAATRSSNGPGCTTPTGKAGDIIFETTSKEAQFCDSTNWVAMGWPCGTSGLTDWNLARQIGKFYGSPPDSSGSFGATSMSISGDTLVVGSYSESGGRGAVYVFVRSGNTWTQQARIVSPYLQNNTYFGWNVSVDGNTLAISQPSWNNTPSSRNSVGRVFVFTRSGSTWSQQAEFSGNDTQYSYFGNRMVISGDTIMSYWQSSSGTGTVYIHKRTGSTWAQEGAFNATNASGSDFFGNPLMALQGDTALAGKLGSSSEIVFFSRSGSTWTRVATLPKPSESDSGFDGGLIMVGDTFIVGAPRDSAPAYNDGAVYVYKKISGVWTKSARITMPSRTGTTAMFGNRLALSADAKTAFIGGNFQAIEVFRDTEGTWNHLATISATDTVAGDGFGASFVPDGNRTLLVAANGDDDNASNSGSVYIFKP